jgi:hypothetical protein
MRRFLALQRWKLEVYSAGGAQDNALKTRPFSSTKRLEDRHDERIAGEHMDREVSSL